MTLYHGVRGFIMQKKFADYQSLNEQSPTWGKAEIVWLRSLADGLFYLLSTAAGFISLFIAYRILAGLPSLDKLEAGASVFVVFLLSIGFLGVTGQLPSLIQAGKFPWSK